MHVQVDMCVCVCTRVHVHAFLCVFKDGYTCIFVSYHRFTVNLE